MHTTPKIKIALADEENIFKKGLQLILEKFERIEVIGEATNALQLHQLITEKGPDIILTDIRMNGCDVLDSIRKIVKHHPSTHVIVLSNHKEDSIIVNVIEAGACGYLLKDVSDDELYTAIEEVQKGNRYYCKTISNKVLKLIANRSYNKAAKQKPIFSKLEEEVMQCICLEMTL